MTTQTQNSGTIQTVMSTELNSLGNTLLVLGSSTSLTSANYPYADAELYVNFNTAPTSGTTMNVWFLKSVDGLNFEDGASGVIPQRNPDILFPMSAYKTQRIIQPCLLPVMSFKPLMYNNGTGQTLFSSGNTLKILPNTNFFA